MKNNLSILVACMVLAGCVTDRLTKKDGVEPALSTSAVSPTPAASPSPEVTTAASTANLVTCNSANGKTAAKNAKVISRKNGRVVKKDESQESDVPCAPGTSVGVAPSTMANSSPATASPAITNGKAVSGARREVAGINDWKGYIEGVPTTSSKFNLLKIGMGEKEVIDLIGAPNDQEAHITGKAFIPFFFGGGGSETILHYKGTGRLIFANSSAFSTSNGLIAIVHDASERGYQ